LFNREHLSVVEVFGFDMFLSASGRWLQMSRRQEVFGEGRVAETLLGTEDFI
jgi:hypothetical protein